MLITHLEVTRRIRDVPNMYGVPKFASRHAAKARRVKPWTTTTSTEYWRDSRTFAVTTLDRMIVAIVGVPNAI
jgi:hypothetical protein